METRHIRQRRKLTPDTTTSTTTTKAPGTKKVSYKRFRPEFGDVFEGWLKKQKKLKKTTPFIVELKKYLKESGEAGILDDDDDDDESDDDVTCGTSSAPTLCVGSTAEAKSFVDTLSFESQQVLLAELMQRMSMAVSKL